MKVLFVITGLGLGGAERQVCDLADRLVEKHDCSVIVVSLTDEIVCRPTNRIVEVVSLEMKKSLAGFIFAQKKFKKILNEFKPDVVHSHMFHANIFTRLTMASKLAKFKLINTAHSINEGGALRMALYKYTQNYATLTTNVSHAATNEYVNKGASLPRNIQTVYNAIDVVKFKYNPGKRISIREQLRVAEGDTVFLSVGRLCDAKDYRNLLNAFAIMLGEGTKDIKLLLVGDGERRQDIEQWIIQFNLSEHVKMLGRRSDIPEILSAADVFVSSSCYEGFPLVIGEAMASSLPVITTNAGGSAEWLGDKTSVVPISDSKKLASVMKAFHEMGDADRRSIGSRNRTRVEKKFSFEVIACQWLKLYSGVNS